MGVSLAGGVYSAVREAKQNKRYQSAVNKEYNKNLADTNAFYQTLYNQNPLERADNQALLNHQKDMLKQANQQATATAAITGATPEAVQAQKNASANQYAQTVSNIAAQNSARKDQIGQEWQAAKGVLRQEKLNNMSALNQQKLANIQKYGQLTAQLGSNAASAYATSATGTATKNAVGDAVSSVTNMHKLNSITNPNVAPSTNYASDAEAQLAKQIKQIGRK